MSFIECIYVILSCYFLLLSCKILIYFFLLKCRLSTKIVVILTFSSSKIKKKDLSNFQLDLDKS